MQLHAYENTHAQQVYERLCRTRGAEAGDPLLIETVLRFDGSDHGSDDPDNFGEPEAIVGRVSNLWTVATGEIVDFARVIILDRRLRITYTDVAWRVGTWTSTFWETDRRRRRRALRDPEKLVRLWESMGGAPRNSAGRTDSALVYFCHSWRSHHLDQACVHLAVTLETLFAPHAQGETSHQIAFNVCRFMGRSPEEREQIYAMTRRFYSIRSAIVHGSEPDWKKCEPAYVEMFDLITRVFRRILLDSAAVSAFKDEDARRKMFRSFLFA